MKLDAGTTATAPEIKLVGGPHPYFWIGERLGASDGSCYATIDAEPFIAYMRRMAESVERQSAKAQA